MSAAVSQAPVADEPLENTASSALEDALVRVLAHYRRPANEMDIALAARADDLGAAVRGVCESRDLLVREIELQSDDLKYAWGPVLATRCGIPVLLLPGIWRRWTAVGVGARSGAVRIEELDPRAFSFYSGLGSEPIPVRALWRRLFGKDNRSDLHYAVVWGVAAALVNAGSVYLLGSLIDGALPDGDRRTVDLLAIGWCSVALTVSNLRLARTLLQWEPRVGLEEGLIKTIEYFRTKVGS